MEHVQDERAASDSELSEPARGVTDSDELSELSRTPSPVNFGAGGSGSEADVESGTEGHSEDDSEHFGYPYHFLRRPLLDEPSPESVAEPVAEPVVHNPSKLAIHNPAVPFDYDMHLEIVSSDLHYKKGHSITDNEKARKKAVKGDFKGAKDHLDEMELHPHTTIWNKITVKRGLCLRSLDWLTSKYCRASPCL